MATEAGRSERVTTLELFFDLVFVFVVTQLTTVLRHRPGLDGLARVLVVLCLIWWMYGGYAWMTNAVPLQRVHHRLLLLAGMGGFFVAALAVPTAFDGSGLAFGLGYLVVVVVHAVLYARGSSGANARAILRIAPWNLLFAAAVVAGGALGGTAQWLLWASAGAWPWLRALIQRPQGFVIGASHFVERHGLVVIVALGESVVVIGAAASGLAIDIGLVVVALLGLALTAALWWTYFGDERDVESAFDALARDDQRHVAITAFGYAHFVLLLGIVAVAAALKEAIAHPADPLPTAFAVQLGAGTAAFVAADVAFRQLLGVGRGGPRALAVLVAPLTILLGTEVSAEAQIAALAVLLPATLVADARVRAQRRRGRGSPTAA
jgi:low temperature requirement protein LtrA